MSDERKSNGSLGTISDMSDLPDIPDSGQFVSTKSSHPSAKRRENIVFMGSIEPLGESKDFLSGVNDVRDRAMNVISKPTFNVAEIDKNDVQSLQQIEGLFAKTFINADDIGALEKFKKVGGVFHPKTMEELKYFLEYPGFKILAIRNQEDSIVAMISTFESTEGQSSDPRLKETIYDPRYLQNISDTALRTRVRNSLKETVWLHYLIADPEKGAGMGRHLLDKILQTTAADGKYLMTEIWRAIRLEGDDSMQEFANPSSRLATNTQAVRIADFQAPDDLAPDCQAWIQLVRWDRRKKEKRMSA